MTYREHMRTTSEQVADYINTIMKRAGLTQNDLEKTLKRSHGYVNTRVNKERSWNLDELDLIAALIGLRDGLELIAKATILIDPRNSPDYLSVREEDVMRSIRHGMLGLAANRDGNKLKEATEDYS